MTTPYESIRKGLEEALDHARGDATNSRVHQVEIPDPDVAGIRALSGLTQVEFAAAIGVAVGTLRGWEQGRRRPEGPARVLLALLAKRPSLVLEELGH
ncbi:MAG: helix-turn-helix domain-containing protein [Oceanicaulis sp.]